MFLMVAFFPARLGAESVRGENDDPFSRDALEIIEKTEAFAFRDVFNDIHGDAGFELAGLEAPRQASGIREKKRVVGSGRFGLFDVRGSDVHARQPGMGHESHGRQAAASHVENTFIT
jgi:hypothetical protein